MFIKLVADDLQFRFIHGSIDVNIPSLNYAGQLDTLGHFVPSAPEAFSFYALGSICRGVSSGFYIQAGESNQYGVIKMGLNNDFNSAGGAQEFYFIPSSYNRKLLISTFSGRREICADHFDF